MVAAVLLQVETGVPAEDPLWWLWLLVAAGFLVIIAYLVSRIGPGGPWARR